MTTPDNIFSTADDGILSLPQLEDAFAKGILCASAPLIAGQIQPASLDLRLGAKAWRVQASFFTWCRQ